MIRYCPEESKASSQPAWRSLNGHLSCLRDLAQEGDIDRLHSYAVEHWPAFIGPHALVPCVDYLASAVIRWRRRALLIRDDDRPADEIVASFIFFEIQRRLRASCYRAVLHRGAVLEVQGSDDPRPVYLRWVLGGVVWVVGFCSSNAYAITPAREGLPLSAATLKALDTASNGLFYRDVEAIG